MKSLLKEVSNKAIENYGTPEDAFQLLELFIYSNWKSFGFPPKHIQSHVVMLLCMNNKIRSMKEIICLILKSTLPYIFIHVGLAMEKPHDQQQPSTGCVIGR
jgi:hypothetical protein